jgi:HEAT repeat protein
VFGCESSTQPAKPAAGSGGNQAQSQKVEPPEQQSVKTPAEKQAADPVVTTRVTKLIEELKDKDTFVRRNAAVYLGRIGPAAKDAVPALRVMSEKDPEASVHRAAAGALKSINK